MILAKMKKKINERGSRAKEKTTNQNQASLFRGYFENFENYKHLMVRVGLNQKISKIQVLRGSELGISKNPNSKSQIRNLTIFISGFQKGMYKLGQLFFIGAVVDILQNRTRWDSSSWDKLLEESPY